MTFVARVVFRGKAFELPLVEANERLRSAAKVSIAKRFLTLVAAECELSAQQLEKHAVFVVTDDSDAGEKRVLDADSPYDSWANEAVQMHLSQVCSVCQIDAENDIGAEYDAAVFTLFCGHTMHRACFEKLANKSCPLCRNALLEVQRQQQQAEGQERQQHEEAEQAQERVQPILVRLRTVTLTPTFSVGREVATATSSFVVPKWSDSDNALIARGAYRLSSDQTVAHPDGNGMMILHSEPLGEGKRYRFAVQMNEEPYCAAALLSSKQEPGTRSFGSDFRICKPLHDNLGHRTVHFDVDMDTRVAKYRFGANDPVKTITGLSETVFVACSVKHKEASIRPLAQF